MASRAPWATSITTAGVIFATRHTTGGGTDIMTVAPDGTARDWLATAASESGPKASPDERYVAYRSDKSGRYEVYVKSISGEGPEQPRAHQATNSAQICWDRMIRSSGQLWRRAGFALSVPLADCPRLVPAIPYRLDRAIGGEWLRRSMAP